MLPPSAPDRLKLDHRSNVSDQRLGEPYSLDEYVQVDSRLVSGQNTGIILTYDQSNGANFVDSIYTMTMANCHMVDPYTGAMLVLKEPIVGCNGGLVSPPFVIGNVWSQTVDKLRGASGGVATWTGRQRVIICCLGAGGTTSKQWAAGGDCNQRLQVGARRMLGLGLIPQVVLRHQGESDSLAANQGNPDFTAIKIRDNIWSEVQTLRTEGIAAPVIVCNVARYDNSSVGTAGYNVTRQGQQLSWDASKGIFPGPDTDTVPGSSRQSDEVHWNATGRNTVSTLFADAIRTRVP